MGHNLFLPHAKSSDAQLHTGRRLNVVERPRLGLDWALLMNVYSSHTNLPRCNTILMDMGRSVLRVTGQRVHVGVYLCYTPKWCHSLELRVFHCSRTLRPSTQLCVKIQSNRTRQERALSPYATRTLSTIQRPCANLFVVQERGSTCHQIRVSVKVDTLDQSANFRQPLRPRLSRRRSGRCRRISHH